MISRFFLQILEHYVLNIPTLDILFSSNHNIHKITYVLWFWALDPLIDRINENLSIKESEAQKKVI